MIALMTVLVFIVVMSTACGNDTESGMSAEDGNSADNISEEFSQNEKTDENETRSREQETEQGEEQEKTPDVEQTLNPEVLYSDILDMFYYNISSDWAEYRTRSSFHDGEVSYLFPQYHFDSSYIDKIGYSFIDLDDNGTPELLIWMREEKDADNPEYKSMIYDLYTYVNGNITHVESSGERDRFYLCEDNTIYNESSGGATDSVMAHYRLNSGEAELSIIESVYTKAADDGEQNIDWYHVTQDGETMVSEAEGLEIWKQMESQTVNFDLTMFSEYVPKN